MNTRLVAAIESSVDLAIRSSMAPMNTILGQISKHLTSLCSKVELLENRTVNSSSSEASSQQALLCTGLSESTTDQGDSYPPENLSESSTRQTTHILDGETVASSTHPPTQERHRESAVAHQPTQERHSEFAAAAETGSSEDEGEEGVSAVRAVKNGGK